VSDFMHRFLKDKGWDRVRDYLLVLLDNQPDLMVSPRLLQDNVWNGDETSPTTTDLPGVVENAPQEGK